MVREKGGKRIMFLTLVDTTYRESGWRMKGRRKRKEEIASGRMMRMDIFFISRTVRFWARKRHFGGTAHIHTMKWGKCPARLRRCGMANSGICTACWNGYTMMTGRKNTFMFSGKIMMDSFLLKSCQISMT